MNKLQPAFVLPTFSIIVLSFIAGAAVMHFRFFPYDFLDRAFRAGEAVNEQERGSPTPFNTNLWSLPYDASIGVVTFEQERALQGYTIFTSGHDNKAFLIDLAGDVVHEWHLPFSQVWDESAARQNPPRDDFIYMRKAHLLPNGDVLAIYVTPVRTPWGLGLVKIDKDSNVIWKYLRHIHHDLDVDADDLIYTLLHKFTDATTPDKYGYQPPYLDDYIVVLSPDGEEIRRISVFDALRNSEFGAYLTGVSRENRVSGDILHINAIRVLPKPNENAPPFACEGCLLISSRSMNTIAILDPKTEEIIWAVRGPWYWQHDPDLLDNGNILIFDNRGDIPARGRSRIIEFNPQTMEIDWVYNGNETQKFESRVRGAQQRLSNGNTLITDSIPGRIFEVDRAGEIVWDYRSPFRAEYEGQDMVAIVSWATRYEPNEISFDFSLQ